MDLLNVKRAINSVLETNFPDVGIYAETVKEGFKRPSFFTQIIEIASNYETKNYMSNKLMVVINFFSKNDTGLENTKMSAALKSAIGMSIQVGERRLTPKNIRSDIVDGVLQFKFDLMYLARIEQVDGHPKMAEIITNLR